MDEYALKQEIKFLEHNIDNLKHEIDDLNDLLEHTFGDATLIIQTLKSRERELARIIEIYELFTNRLPSNS